jgi:hypothetical protein
MCKCDAGQTGVTENRRAHLSPYVTSGTIDPTLGLIRVDAALPTPHPLALLWNFAVRLPFHVLSSG